MIKKPSFFPYPLENVHPGFSIDCVILSYYKKKLRVLLNKFEKNKNWQLPGGFLLDDENTNEAASRILKTRTGLENVYLKQFHLFSDPERTKAQQNVDALERHSAGEENLEEVKAFFQKRFLSLGYYAFVKYDDIQLSFTKEDTAKWFDIGNLPELLADHNNIIQTALNTIRITLPVIPIGHELLPSKFTMSDLRRIYEIFLEKSFDRRNFQRKVLSTGILVQLDETANSSPYNPPILYSFVDEHKEINHFISF